MTFFRTMYLSATSPRFYAAILHAPIGKTWKYFTKLHVLLALVSILPIVVFLALADARNLIEPVVKFFPADLDVRIVNGELSINQPLPYKIAVPERMREHFEGATPPPANAVVFTDENSVGSLTSLLAQDALVVMTEKAAYIRDENSQMRAFMLPKSDEEIHINQNVVAAKLKSFADHPFIAYRLYVLPVAILLFITIFVVFFCVDAFMLLIYCAIVWVLARLFLRARKYSYATLYHMGLHAITLILLVDAACGFLGLEFFRVPVQLLAFLAWMMWILSELSVMPMEVIESPVQHAKTSHKRAVHHAHSVSSHAHEAAEENPKKKKPTPRKNQKR